LEATLRSFPAGVYTQVRLVELVHLDDLATVLLPAALLATGIVALLTIRRPKSTWWLAVTALGLLLAAFIIIISALISVPINTDQQAWSVLAPPGEWAAVRDRWQLAHLARTSAAVFAFVALAAAAITQRSPARRTQ
jgi:Anthrone oxygenase